MSEQEQTEYQLALPGEYHDHIHSRIYEDWEELCKAHETLIGVTLETAEGTELLRAQGAMRQLRILRDWAKTTLDQMKAENEQEQ